MIKFNYSAADEGHEAERAAVLAEAHFVANRIVAVTGQTHEVGWELSLADKAWANVLADLPDEVPPTDDEVLALASNLMRDSEPKVVFDYWHDALASRIRWCTTWVAKASGSDAAVLAELASIENYYAAALMQAESTLSSPFVELVLKDEQLRQLATFARRRGPSGSSTAGWMADVIEVIGRMPPAA